eukprot:10733610-Lingulodinium_polyedra.AAC.1
MAQSSASGGSNPFRRVCNPCGATDRAAARRNAVIERTRKNNEILLDADIDVRKQIKSLSAEQKAQWYRDQSDARVDEEENSRRNFTQPKGTLEHSSTDSAFRKEMDMFRA